MTIWSLQGPVLIVLGIAGAVGAIIAGTGVPIFSTGIAVVNALMLLGFGITWTWQDFR